MDDVREGSGDGGGGGWGRGWVGVSGIGGASLTICHLIQFQGSSPQKNKLSNGYKRSK